MALLVLSLWCGKHRGRKWRLRAEDARKKRKMDFFSLVMYQVMFKQVPPQFSLPELCILRLPPSCVWLDTLWVLLLQGQGSCHSWDCPGLSTALSPPGIPTCSGF